MYKIGDTVVCTNIVDWRNGYKVAMKHIFLGHKYLVLKISDKYGRSAELITLRVKDVETGKCPGYYSTIFFSKCPIKLNNKVKVL